MLDAIVSLRDRDSEIGNVDSHCNCRICSCEQSFMRNTNFSTVYVSLALSLERES